MPSCGMFRSCLGSVVKITNKPPKTALMQLAGGVQEARAKPERGRQQGFLQELRAQLLQRCFVGSIARQVGA